jgi:hypothetical protein
MDHDGSTNPIYDQSVNRMGMATSYPDPYSPTGGFSMDREPFQIEAEEAGKGLNAMFGEWRKRFDFEPVPHSNRGDQRRLFQDRLRSELGVEFL